MGSIWIGGLPVAIDTNETEAVPNTPTVDSDVTSSGTAVDLDGDDGALVPEAVRKQRREYGHHVLGPIVEWYLYRLDAHLQVLADRGALSLFVARAGIRIEELYNIYLANRGRVPSPDHHMLWASRILFCKTFALAAPEEVDTQLHRNFRGKSVGDLLNAMFRHEPEMAQSLDLNDNGLHLPADRFSCADLAGSLAMNNQKVVAGYLEQYARMGGDYLADLGYEKGRPVVLIDSGWQGSMHLLAQAGLAPSTVESLYFGAMPIDEDCAVPRGITGLLFETGEYDLSRPETSLVHYRHLIESVFEANVESAETLALNSTKSGFLSKAPFRRRSTDVSDLDVFCPQQDVDRPDEHRGLDALYLGVRDYLREPGERTPATLATRFEVAASELAAAITYPTELAVEVLSAGSRDADFGRAGGMTVPMPAVDRNSSDTPQRRVVDSLWPQAQAVIELDAASARQVHNQYSKGLTAAAYFHGPKGEEGKSAVDNTVTICTRTKDRPILLKRAARSVADQTYRDIQWVVVNDGGDREEVVRVLDECAVDPGRITLVSHRESQGMEAASNAGISAVDGGFIVIHDDDDSWEPTFLERAVEFLTSEAGSHYGGVVLGSTRVDEIIRGDEVEIVGREPYNGWLRQVNLPEMLGGNSFPPIAFVFRRALYDAVDGFDETLPVLGDWDFNIRLLHHADIAVIPEALANYHHRVAGSSISYGNSVTAGVSKHAEYRSRLLNRYLRGTLGQSTAGLVLQAYVHGSLRNEIRNNQGSSPGSALVSPLLDDLWVLAQWLIRSPDSPLTGSFENPATAVSELADAALVDDVVLAAMDPPPNFDEDGYRKLYPDVAEAVRGGGFGSGYEHYIRHGRPEGRERTGL